MLKILRTTDLYCFKLPPWILFFLKGRNAVNERKMWKSEQNKNKKAARVWSFFFLSHKELHCNLKPPGTTTHRKQQSPTFGSSFVGNRADQRQSLLCSNHVKQEFRQQSNGKSAERSTLLYSKNLVQKIHITFTLFPIKNRLNGCSILSRNRAPLPSFSLQHS